MTSITNNSEPLNLNILPLALKQHVCTFIRTDFQVRKVSSQWKIAMESTGDWDSLQKTMWNTVEKLVIVDACGKETTNAYESWKQRLMSVGLLQLTDELIKTCKLKPPLHRQIDIIRKGEYPITHENWSINLAPTLAVYRSMKQVVRAMEYMGEDFENKKNRFIAECCLSL